MLQQAGAGGLPPPAHELDGGPQRGGERGEEAAALRQVRPPRGGAQEARKRLHGQHGQLGVCRAGAAGAVAPQRRQPAGELGAEVGGELQLLDARGCHGASTIRALDPLRGLRLQLLRGRGRAADAIENRDWEALQALRAAGLPGGQAAAAPITSLPMPPMPPPPARTVSAPIGSVAIRARLTPSGWSGVGGFGVVVGGSSASEEGIPRRGELLALFMPAIPTMFWGGLAVQRVLIGRTLYRCSWVDPLETRRWSWDA